MSDLPEEPANESRKKPSAWLDALLGLAVSAAAYLAMAALVSLFSFSAPLTVIGECVILASYGLLTVKFFRTGHSLAAYLMLVLIAPLVFILLAVGACMAAGPLFG